MKLIERLFGKPDFPAFDGVPPSEPAQMVVAFLEDYKVWSDFAWAEHQKSSRSALAEQSYDALLRKYCGSGKNRQLLTFSSDPSFNPLTDRIVDIITSEETTMVRVKHGNGGWNECIYEFDFERRADQWVLNELYYLDEYEQNARLKML